MSKTVITIEHIARGQPRAYSDSFYKARISAERHGVYTNGRVVPLPLSLQDVKDLTQRFVHEFSEKPEWHESRLKFATPRQPGEIAGEERSPEWEVLVVQPFLD